MEAEIKRKKGLRIHLILFVLTFITTTLAGALQEGVNPISNPWQIPQGFPFALTLMTILLVHEMGHYLTARHHQVDATLPYFIPAPSIIGTFGAFIRMSSPPKDRRSLFDVGAAGPLAGLALAVPAVVVGLKLSTVTVEGGGEGGFVLGSSLLLNFLQQITLGPLPEGSGIVMHPIGFAGWIGLFVTAMNLIPVGQLDGGHVVYALFGPRYIWVSRIGVAVLLSLGLLRWWDGWLIWGLLLLLMGVRHPPPLDPYTPLDVKRRLMGWMMLVILVITFIPAPFTFREPEVRENRAAPPPSVEPRSNGAHL